MVENNKWKAYFDSIFVSSNFVLVYFVDTSSDFKFNNVYLKNDSSRWNLKHKFGMALLLITHVMPPWIDVWSKNYDFV